MLEPDLLFPAYAGVILGLVEGGRVTLSFPRIRGGDPFKILRVKVFDDFSPHTRG